MKKLVFLLPTGGKTKEEIVREGAALLRKHGMLRERAAPTPREPEQLRLPFASIYRDRRE